MTERMQVIADGEWSFDKLAELLSVAHEHASSQLESAVLAMRMLKSLRDVDPERKAKRASRNAAKDICVKLLMATGLPEFDWSSKHCVGKSLEQIILKRYEETR